MLRHSRIQQSSLKRSLSSSSLTEYGKHYRDGITKNSFIVEDSTLFEPIPYDGMDKDEKSYIEKQIKYHKLRDPDFEKTNILLDFHKLTGFDSGKEDVKAGAVVEVIYITICNDELDVHLLDGYKMYGTISAIDYAGNTFFIYNRKEGDPKAQLLSPDHELYLTGRNIVPMRGGLTFHLFNSHAEEVFSTTAYVDYKFKHDCEDQDLVIVKGKAGFYAKMVCVVVPFALIAMVDVVLIGPSDPKTIDVEGEIIMNNYSLLKENTFKLVDERGKNSIFRAEQYRTVLAVPAYALLYVEFELSSHGTEFATGALTSDPCEPPIRLYIDCKKDGYKFFVVETWFHPDNFFRFDHKKYKLPGAVLPDYYVEVFSIFVGGGNSTPPALCGSIVVQDKKETVYIFSRKSCCPDNLSSNEFRRTVSLVWPSNRWVLEKDFYMHLKLKDVNNRTIGRGSLSWYSDCDWCPERFDKRMCAVIEGENGYFVAVHYSIFIDGLRAKVTVTVECGDPCDHFDVYGSVCAQYSNCDYRSAYDKEYYQIIIFNRSYEYRAKVRNGSKKSFSKNLVTAPSYAKVRNGSVIPLSKSLVTAPSDCTCLQIFVRLTVRPCMDPDIPTSDLHAFGKLLFKADDINSSKQLFMYRQQGYVPLGTIKVNVDWSV